MLEPIFLNELIVKNINSSWAAALHLGTKKTFPVGLKLSNNHEGKFYYIVKGRVRMCYTNSMGHELLINYVEEGCLLGDIGAFILSQTTVFECMTEVLVYQFPHSLLHNIEFIQTYPELYHNLLESWAKKSRHLFERACSIILYTPKNQLCNFIYQLVKEQGNNPTPNITHEELSAFLGIHRSTLTRTIRNMRDEGLIGAFTKTRVEVLNLEGIMECVSL